jgi:hypothetical protein
MASPDPADLILRRLNTGTASSPELEASVGLSQSAVSRQLRALMAERKILRIGSTRGARYGSLRSIEGIGSQWPVHRVDPRGSVQILGTLHALAANEYYFEATDSSFAWGGLSSGLPYFLQDQRPAGFLGRAVPRRYPELNLPQRVSDWNDDHYLRYLVQRGSDVVGDLIVGKSALNEYLATVGQRVPLQPSDREREYPRLANEVMEGGLPGSSAHGEHPKFATLIEESSKITHVLVKFSPTMGTPAGRRWSDLLVAEHLAHEVLRDAKISAAQSRIDHFADQAFLEVTRFDRKGRNGRIGVTSLFAIDTAQYGALDNWAAAAERLHSDGSIDANTLETIRLLAAFGALIANTDRHFGNLAFFDRYDGNFSLAPVYDMLPMLFAPEHAQVVARTFTPEPPTADTLRVYGRARDLAATYWQRLSEDRRISSEFRAMSAACRQTLLGLSTSPTETAASADRHTDPSARPSGRRRPGPAGR